jgi:hypothetical protein
MYIRTTFNDPKNTDIVVDWGDNTITVLKDCTQVTNIDNQLKQYILVSSKDNDVCIQLKHKYSSTGKYIVKIFGKNYYNIYTPDRDSGEDNLICRVLDNDLPIASHIINMSSFYRNSIRLLKVKLPEYYDITKWINVSNMFIYCTNLLSLTGFENKFKCLQSFDKFIANTTSLQECDLTIPAVLYRDNNLSAFATNCNYIDLDMLFSHNALSAVKVVNVNKAFSGCKFKEGTIVPADKLWDDKTKTWKNTTSCFANCSDEIKSQVPMSWGGTATLKITFVDGTIQYYAIPGTITRDKIVAAGIAESFDITNKQYVSLIHGGPLHIEFLGKVTNVDDYSFCNITTLKTIKFDTTSNVVISTCAFFGCLSLTDVTLTDKVTRIDTRAFDECVILRDITIPKSVESFGKYFLPRQGIIQYIIFEDRKRSEIKALTGYVNETEYRITPGIKVICSDGYYISE